MSDFGPDSQPHVVERTSLSTVRLAGFSARDVELFRVVLRRPVGAGTSLEVVDSDNADLLIANMAQPDAASAVEARNQPGRTIGIVTQFSSTAPFYQVQQNAQLLYSLAQGINRIREGWYPPHLLSPPSGDTASDAPLADASPEAEAHSVATLAAADDLASAPAAPSLVAQSGAGKRPLTSLPWQRSLSVLVVDDSAFSRAAMQEVLGKAGFTVDTAPSGEEGVRKATETRYDVALVDFEMPGIKGPETIRRMRAIGANTPQLLMMLTSRTGAVDRLRAKFAGCDAYLGKPTSVKEFVDVLSQFAAQGRLKRA